MFNATADGDELPHKQLPWQACIIVEQAIVRAWQWMIDKPQHGFDLHTALENGVTHQLHETLFDVVFKKELVDGFNKDVFTIGTRGAELRNFDGNKRDLKPDLLVGFVTRPSVAYPTQDWLFIECKPVDDDHTVGKHYCNKGIIRFIEGDYAWTMTSALMIGYARSGYTILPKLPNALASASRTKMIPTLTAPQPCKRSKASLTNEVVHVSQHQRTFKYVENGKAAPAITIRHLWLKRD